MITENKSSLITRVLVIYFLALAGTGTLIFVPAGTLKFWNGWLFIVAIFIPMFCAFIYLANKNPGLLAKRLKTREKEKPQKIYLIFTWIVFLSIFIIPGLDFRFSWSDVPLPVVLVSTLLMLSGYLMFFFVMKQNAYASRIIEIQDEQMVIDTGLYSVVRHPMYLSSIILWGFASLVLGSFYGLIPIIFFLAFMIIRIRTEEKVLKSGLKGYDEYMKRVKYRLFPYIW
jgi:protein-S-isoprenylcysteine O-methyltransferase Ste14